MVKRKIRILDSFSGWKEDAVTYKTNASLEATQNLNLHAYEDVPGERTGVGLFFERVLLGDQFPGTLILGDAKCLGAPMIAALFVAPDLVLEDQCSSLVHSFSLAIRYGDVGFSHIPNDHASILNQCSLVLQGGEVKEKQIMKSTRIIEAYLRHGRTESFLYEKPSLVNEEKPFFVFEENSPLGKCWAWKEGFTCGLILGKRPLYLRKSALCKDLNFDLLRELLCSKEEGWYIEGNFLQRKEPTDIDNDELIDLGKKALS